MSVILREGELERILQKHPDKVPVIVQKSKQARGDSLPEIHKNKFLAPASLTMAQFVSTVRKLVKLQPEQAIFLFVNDQMPNTGSTMRQVYEQYKSIDGALHISYATENTFGGLF